MREYAEDPDDAQCLEQWRPYIVRMNAVAQAMLAVQRKEHLKAVDTVKEAIAAIEALERMEECPTFDVERDRSLEVLRSLEAEIGSTRPLSEMEQLQKELQEAVEEEDYEHAAELRDMIQLFETGAEEA